MSTRVHPLDERAPASGRSLLAALVRERRRGLAIGAAVGLAWSAGKIAVPRLTSTAIDRSIVGADSPMMWAGSIGAAAVLAGVFAGWRRWLAFHESRVAETDLRERLVDHVLTLDAAYHDRTRTGDLMSRASSDLQQVQGFVVMIPLTLSQLAMVAGVVVLLVLTEPLLALIALAPLPLVNVLAQRFSRRIHPAVTAVQAEQARLAGVVEETVAGIRVIKGFGAESVQAKATAAAADDIRAVSMDAARVRSAFLPALDLLPNLGLVAVLAIGGSRVIDGTMTYGRMVEFLQYIALIVAPLRSIGMTVAFAQRAMVALIRLDEVLRARPTVLDPTTPCHPPGLPGAAGVALRDVWFGYPGTAAPVLAGVDLVIAPGESVAIVGATGSGKSTIARLLLRWYDVDSGSIELDGVDIRDLPLDRLRGEVGVVFEDTFLFDDTIGGNIAFARPDASPSEIVEAARTAGLHDVVAGLPAGFETRVGQRGYSLSGGQRQRVAIARALVADPRVLVLDDATSAVDPSKEHEIRAAMATAMAGRTTIVIAHRLGTIALATRVAFLAEGRIVATGAHDHLLATVPAYRDVLAAFESGDGVEAVR